MPPDKAKDLEKNSGKIRGIKYPIANSSLQRFKFTSIVDGVEPRNLLRHLEYLNGHFLTNHFFSFKRKFTINNRKDYLENAVHFKYTFLKRKKFKRTRALLHSRVTNTYLKFTTFINNTL